MGESGGIGRRAGFRFLWANACGGSTPPFRTNHFLCDVGILFGREMRLEARGLEALSPSLLLGVLVVLLISFGLEGVGAGPGLALAVAVWIAVAAAGGPLFGRMFLRERASGAIRGLLMTPAGGGAIYLAKTAAAALTLTFVYSVVFLLSFFLLSPPLDGMAAAYGVGLAAMPGIAAAGAIFGSLSLRTRTRDLFIGASLLAVALPLLLVSLQATAAHLEGRGAASFGAWVGVVLLIDALYLILGLLLSRTLFEEA